jgi:hypothetical protein
VDVETERTDMVVDLTEALSQKWFAQNDVGSSKLKIGIEIEDG